MVSSLVSIFAFCRRCLLALAVYFNPALLTVITTITASTSTSCTSNLTPTQLHTSPWQILLTRSFGVLYRICV